jgi:peptidoglycan/xylan/chitin deacetylase (PgdA/CDA1 family)
MAVKLVQCWDDGIVDDIRLCELLRRHGAAASFNLNWGVLQSKRFLGGNYRGKEAWKLARTEIKEVYAGFLVANHTAHHPHLTQVSLEDARREIMEGREALEQAVGYAVEGFAYPYGDHNPAVRQLVREAGHLYARTCEETSPVWPPKDAMSFGPSCHFLAADFWARFERVRATGGVFYFWGHSYEFLTEDDWSAFDDKIARLGAQGDWVTLPSLFRGVS